MTTAERVQPVDRLAQIRSRMDQLIRERASAVAYARREGSSWAEIADALGIARQSAWELFRDEVATLERNRQQSSLSEAEALEIAVAATDEARKRRYRRAR